MQTSLPNSPATTRFLLILFLLSLPLFMLMRWDISPWLNQQIDSAAKDSGIILEYEHVTISGIGLSFDNITINQANKNSIRLDQLQVSLSVSKLFTGALAANINALWLANPIALTIMQADGNIEIFDLNANIDLLNLADIQQQLPLRATGMVKITGNISIQQSTMLPAQASLDIAWNKAEAGLSAPEFQLGDYLLNIQNGEDANQAWDWNISGGTDVALDGKGRISLQPNNIQQSNISGTVDINVSPNNATLAMMVQAFAGSSKAKIRLSGSIASPRTNIVR